MQIPDTYVLTECVFHMNSLFLRQTGLIHEELVIQAVSSVEQQTVVKILDLSPIKEEYSY